MCADRRPTFLHAVTAVSWQHGIANVQSVPEHGLWWPSASRYCQMTHHTSCLAWIFFNIHPTHNHSMRMRNQVPLDSTSTVHVKSNSNVYSACICQLRSQQCSHLQTGFQGYTYLTLREKTSCWMNVCSQPCLETHTLCHFQKRFLKNLWFSPKCIKPTCVIVSPVTASVGRLLWRDKTCPACT